MKKELKWIIAVLVFALFIGGAYLLYDKLGDEFAPDRLAEGDFTKKEPLKNEKPKKKPNKEEENVDENTTQTKENETGDEDVTQVEEDENDEDKAPDFTVYGRKGNAVTLYSMRGKPTVVNFWASWCPPCKEELPDFEKMYLKMGDKVNFMMVDMTDGYQETREKGENYIAEQGFTFPLYFDLEQDAAYTYGIQSLPTTVFYDKEGNMITYAFGMIDYETLLKGIEMITE